MTRLIITNRNVYTATLNNRRAIVYAANTYTDPVNNFYVAYYKRNAVGAWRRVYPDGITPTPYGAAAAIKVANAYVGWLS